MFSRCGVFRGQRPIEACHDAQGSAVPIRVVRHRGNASIGKERCSRACPSDRRRCGRHGWLARNKKGPRETPNARMTILICSAEYRRKRRRSKEQNGNNFVAGGGQTLRGQSFHRTKTERQDSERRPKAKAERQIGTKFGERVCYMSPEFREFPVECLSGRGSGGGRDRTTNLRFSREESVILHSPF